MNELMLNNFVLSLTGIIMLVAAGYDAVRYRIPNLTSLSLLLLFPVYVLIAPVTVPWGEHLVVFAVLLVLGYLVYLKNWVGAGDIKLLSVVGLWAGPTHVATFLFVTALAGGLLALALGTGLLIRTYVTKKPSANSFAKTPIPYGVAIAIGGLCTLVLLSHPELLQAKI